MSAPATASTEPTRLYVGGRVLTMRTATLEPQTLTLAEQAGRLCAVGEPAELQQRYPHAERFELDGRLVTPGLIDCHTHLVHAGQRAAELERVLAGESYAAIAREGGGIARTVRETAAASDAALLAQSLRRLDALLAEGVTVVEVKSGYALTLEGERRLLSLARSLGAARRVTVRTTYLAAHSLPPAYPGGADAYIARLCREDLPAIAASGLADAVDAFCEQIAFSPAQVERLLARARALGLPCKLHADQLSNLQGAALAARFAALSADHLEHTDEAGVAALARSGTVAVLLPGACHFLREPRRPPIQALRAARVPLAVATDCNPGSSPLRSLLAAMNLAAVLFGLSTAECLGGVTREAARALGLLEQCGTLEAGKWCDLAIWDVQDPAELVQSLGAAPLHRRVWHGQRGASFSTPR